MENVLRIEKILDFCDVPQLFVARDAFDTLYLCLLYEDELLCRYTGIRISARRLEDFLSVARAYLSIFPSEKAEEIIKNVNDNMKSIRYELGTRVRHQLRIIPELKFFVDDSLDYLEKIDELLK